MEIAFALKSEADPAAQCRIVTEFTVSVAQWLERPLAAREDVSTQVQSPARPLIPKRKKWYLFLSSLVAQIYKWGGEIYWWIIQYSSHGCCSGSMVADAVKQ